MERGIDSWAEANHGAKGPNVGGYSDVAIRVRFRDYTRLKQRDRAGQEIG
jgi:hypothetical protein